MVPLSDSAFWKFQPQFWHDTSGAAYFIADFFFFFCFSLKKKKERKKIGIFIWQCSTKPKFEPKFQQKNNNKPSPLSHSLISHCTVGVLWMHILKFLPLRSQMMTMMMMIMVMKMVILMMMVLMTVENVLISYCVHFSFSADHTPAARWKVQEYLFSLSTSASTVTQSATEMKSAPQKRKGHRQNMTYPPQYLRQWLFMKCKAFSNMAVEELLCLIK